MATAQYTEKINSNRPGTSQGAFSVGNNVLQLEGGFGFGKEKHKIFDTKTNIFNLDYAVRYGLLIEQLEIRLNGRFRADGVRQTVGANEQKINRSDFEINTLGAKYLIYDPYKKPKKIDSTYASLKSWKEHHRFKWRTLIPAVSAYAGVNFISADNPFTFPEDESISPLFVIATQNNWTTDYGGDWAFVTNLIIDKITTENPAFGLIMTATHTVNDKWAGFLEYQVQKSDFYSDNIMRVGGAYLFNQDVQFDANIAFNFKDTPSVFTCSFGASYRFDWHTKDEIIEKPGLEGGVKEGEEDEDSEEGEEGEGEDGIEGELDELEESETDSLKIGRTPFVNEFEDDSFREEMERDLDERRTAERLERERIEQEKIDKKESKKFKKEEARRLKREAKEARAAEKAAIKAEKEKQKMIEDIDAELDKMEQDKGVDDELEDLDRQLKELEKMEQELNEEEKEQDKPKDKPVEKKKEEEIDIDAEYEQYQKEQAKAKKEEEKRRKKEEKRRLKEDKKRKKEEAKRKNQEEKDNNLEDDIDKELEKFDQ
ncbi:hypothetical protein GCM10022258_15420 [Aquimarina gracilis]